jgi:hypothetical protein
MMLCMLEAVEVVTHVVEVVDGVAAGAARLSVRILSIHCLSDAVILFDWRYRPAWRRYITHRATAATRLTMTFQRCCGTLRLG